MMRLFFSNENKFGLGVVIRNNFGLVIASCSEKLSKAYTCEEIEALTAVKALSFALELGITKAVLEGDSLVVFKVLIYEDGFLAPDGLLVEDAKILSQGFNQLLYPYTKRECNFV